ncbi:MAG: hypothetical protein NTU76_02955 [Candidatus Taylorbacteria bacterium]|nr:hypothetical protein [Candidatus Taylorbacteria bacterium]
MLDLFFQKVYAASGPDAIGSNGSTPIIYLLVGLAVIYFLWGMFEFIQNADNSSKREDGYKHMIYGVIGLVIIFSVNGIIALITSTLGIAQ